MPSERAERGRHTADVETGHPFHPALQHTFDMVSGVRQGTRHPGDVLGSQMGQCREARGGDIACHWLYLLGRKPISPCQLGRKVERLRNQHLKKKPSKHFVSCLLLVEEMASVNPR